MEPKSTPTGIKCRVTIRTATAVTTFAGVFPSTTDAVIHGIEQLGEQPGRVSVRAI